MLPNSDRRLMVRYLLGELPRYEHKLVEKKFFSDNAFFERLLEAEDSLINDYVQGRLPEHERLQFERYFLSTPQKRQKVELYRNKQDGVTTAEASSIQSKSGAADYSLTKRKAIGWWETLTAFFQGRRLIGQIAAVCLALALLISLWLYISTKKSSDRLASNPEAVPRISVPSNPSQKTEATPQIINDNQGSNEERIKPPDQPANTVHPTPKGQPRSTNGGSNDKHTTPLIATLLPGLTRDNSQIPTIDLSSGASSLALKIDLQEDRFDSYRAVLMKREQGGDDKPIHRWQRSKSQRQDTGTSLNLILPVARLVSGFYYLELYGASAGKEEKVDRFPFEIINR